MTGRLNHVGIAIPSIEESARPCRELQGATLLGAGEPCLGGHGAPVIVPHPEATGGVLVEVIQQPDAGR